MRLQQIALNANGHSSDRFGCATDNSGVACVYLRWWQQQASESIAGIYTSPVGAGTVKSASGAGR